MDYNILITPLMSAASFFVGLSIGTESIISASVGLVLGLAAFGCVMLTKRGSVDEVDEKKWFYG